jgi:predicted PurR-regulated permease PerM
MDNALLLAIIAGVFEIIPLFGPILAAIPAVAIALLDGGVTSALLVVGLYIIVQQFENQLIYPLVVRKIVGVPPIVSILALIVGGTLAGFIGLIISVPMAAVIMEFFNDLEKDKLSKAEKLKEALS